MLQRACGEMRSISRRRLTFRTPTCLRLAPHRRKERVFRLAYLMILSSFLDATFRSCGMPTDSACPIYLQPAPAQTKGCRPYLNVARTCLETRWRLFLSQASERMQLFTRSRWTHTQMPLGSKTNLSVKSAYTSK